MNAISRLWWAGYLTYDDNNAVDKYHLTSILFTRQQISADLLDTPFCGNKRIIMGILSGLKLYIDTTKTVSVDKFRECIKYLRRYAAVTAIDYLTSEEISKLTCDFLMKN